MRFVMACILLCAVVSSSLEVEAQGRMRKPPPVAAIAPGVNFPWYPGAPFGLPPDLFYRPFSWAAPIYPAPIVPAPIYLAPLYTLSPYIAKQTKSIASNQTEELSYRLGRLTKEIERARRERQQTPQTETEPTPAPDIPVLPTILVFRDGHRIEIQDYAIADQTLWVFMGRGATRIPITDLDLETTRDVNAGRGVRFPLPK
jgi:hypothetical protein